MLFTLLLLLNLTTSAESAGNSRLSGKLTDSKTGENLVAASIRVGGTTSGTISNADGNYQLDLPAGKHTLIFSYVGYRTDTVSFQLTKNSLLNHQMVPMDILFPEVTINASEDPGVAIMRAAIRNKKDNLKGLKSFSFAAYSKSWLKTDGKMAFVQETFLDGVQETGKPLKEFVRSIRKTENIKTSRMRAPTLNQFIDLTENRLKFGDDVSIILPLADDAFDYYDFKLVSTKTDGSQAFYTISVIPKSRVSPLSKGTVTIEGDKYALVGANLGNSEGVKIPYVEKLRLNYSQTFTQYNGYWIPQVTVSTASLVVNFGGLISLDEIEVSQSYAMTSVKVNTDVPPEIAKAKKSVYGGFTTDTTGQTKLPDWMKKRRSKNPPDERFVRTTPTEKPVEFTATLEDTLRPVPLSDLEIAAFKELDSTKILEDLIKPKGVLSGMATVNFGSEKKKEKEWHETLREGLFKYGSIRNNRVEGLYLGVGFDYDSLTTPWFFKSEAGYAFSLKQPEGQLTGGWYLGPDFLDQVDLTLFHQVKPYPAWSVHDPLEVTLLHTIFGSDPWNYTVNSGFSGGFSYFFTDSLTVRAEFTGEQIRNERAHTPLSFFNRTTNFRQNPAVTEGWDSKASLQFRWGQDPTGLSVSRQNGLIIRTDFSKSWLGSDFDYTSVMLNGQVRIPTIYSQNLLAPYLLIRTELLGAFGKPTFRQIFTPSTALDRVTVSGVFNGLKPWELYGDRMVSVWAEHNWRSVPFQWIYLDWVAEKAIEINTGGGFVSASQKSTSFGKSVITKPYWEVYGGVSRLFGLFRVDVTYTSRKDWVTTVGLGSLF
ncbi:MAG: DUF5686 and carboxypeptidase regulatory-like domain-containing protein [Bacteroidetes bacterium]|nr:DUF5686 and carboxypeptidase regulatory-like domain-containing protein [Bacteroidota bacterium]